MNKYEEISPKAAKWIMPDGTTTDAMPVTIVPGMGGVFTSGTAPDASFGRLGDFCITPEGIYTKKMVQTGGGFMLACEDERFNGFWRDMGVNEVISNYGGDPQDSHYYQHESDLYFLCWNTAYSGYWWINTQLNLDDGGATAYRSTPDFTPTPPNDNWSGAFPYGTTVTWTRVQPSSPHPGWEMCFNFKAKNGLPYYKASRLMKYSEGIVSVQGNNGISMYLYPDNATGGMVLYAYLSIGGNGNMARVDSNNQLFIGEPYFVTHSPTGATQALSISYYRNFKINLSAAAIALSFSGSLPTESYPVTIKVWLIPKASATGSPKHTVTWPSNVYWASTNAHKKIGAAGQPDTPVLVELTTFDSGATWIGRAYNALYPTLEQEV